MELIAMRLDDIKPYERNPRLNDEAVDAVMKSIKQCTYVAPIIVDEDNVILAGHTRWKALRKLRSKGYKSKKLDYDSIPVNRATGMTDTQKRKYRALDNKTGEIASWDFKLLPGELEGLDFEDLFLDWGVELVQPRVEEDNYDPALPEEPKSKQGQMYGLGRHRLYIGDSTVQEDVATLMMGMLADMLLTDPPYNIDYEGAAGKIMNDNLPSAKFRQFLLDAFTNAKRVMKPGAAFHIWHGDSEGYNFRGACMDAGLVIRQCLIWVKNQMVLGRQDFQWQHEPCLYGENPDDEVGDEHAPCMYGWKDGAAHRWYKNRKQKTVLQFDKPVVSKEHPTMKPVKLFDYQMQCNTKSNDIVLDLFAGSGTAIIAAEQNGRTAYCMEYDPKYADVIIERWEALTGEKAVLMDDAWFLTIILAFEKMGGVEDGQTEG